MKEYMTSLGVILMLISFSNMLIPEGGIKKYTSLAMGFMLICAALSFLPSDMGETVFDAQSYTLSEKEVATAEAQYKAEVLKRHRKNLEKSIEEKLRYGGRAYVEVSPGGEVISVTLLIKGDESRAISYIVSNLGIDRERINLKYDKN